MSKMKFKCPKCGSKDLGHSIYTVRCRDCNHVSETLSDWIVKEIEQ